MAAINFNTSNETFRKLMGNGISYLVPKFQRDYSWDEDEWDDLWQDILEAWKDREAVHYMGYLVLQSSDSKNFDIIDGQQRMTTLSILVLAVLKNLKELQAKNIDAENNKKREEQLRNTYIGYLDPVTLISKSKLQLNKHNDSLYQNYLAPLQDAPLRGLNFSEKLLKKAFSWFEERVKKDISDRDGSALAGFVDSIADKLFFTVITVTDELNAFKVFETLNARGVRLSATDLLKNYLFSVVNNENPHESEMKNIEDRWENIVGKLGRESFPDFLRVYWNSRNRLVRKSDLFKAIKKNIQNKEDVFLLIRELNDNADFYAALRNPEDELWDNEQRKHIGELKMFSVKQPYSLLMATFEKFVPGDFNRVLKICSVLSFRYNVICGLHTGDQEKVYNDIAFKVATQEIGTVDQLVAKLKVIYPEDEIFRAAFSEKELSIIAPRNRRVVRYILFSLERQLSDADYELESEKYNIEHILPESPGANWPDFDERTDHRFISRLGNYTLLKRKENQTIGNESFGEKKDIYASSNFMITKQISEENDSWNTERIIVRQKKMAKWATSVWRI